MKNLKIRTMPAGRELDALVGYHLFDWRWRRHLTWDLTPDEERAGVRSSEVHVLFDEPPFLPCEWKSDPLDGFTAWRQYAVDGAYEWNHLPRYSADVAAAWQIAERITNAFGLKIVVLPGAAEVHWTTAPPASPRWRELVGSGETLPLALCRCALLTQLSEAPCPDPSPR